MATPSWAPFLDGGNYMNEEQQQLINIKELALSALKNLPGYRYNVSIDDHVVTIELTKTNHDAMELFDAVDVPMSEIDKIKGYTYRLNLLGRNDNAIIAIEKRHNTFAEVISSIETDLDEQTVEDFIQFIYQSIYGEVDESTSHVRVENGRIYIDSNKEFFDEHGVGELHTPLVKMIGTTNKFSTPCFDMKLI